MVVYTNTSKPKLVDCYLVKNTKLKRRRKRRKNRYFAKAAKVLVVSELIAIFYAGHGKS